MTSYPLDEDTIYQLNNILEWGSGESAPGRWFYFYGDARALSAVRELMSVNHGPLVDADTQNMGGSSADEVAASVARRVQHMLAVAEGGAKIVWVDLSRVALDDAAAQERRIMLARLNERRYLLENSKGTLFAFAFPPGFGSTPDCQVAPDLFHARAASFLLQSRSGPVAEQQRNGRPGPSA